MKFKEKWPGLKENISNAIKFILFSLLMIEGWWLSYALIWFVIGLPLVDWAFGLLFGLAIVSELLYIKWISN